MNWVALHTNPDWREFFESDEIQDKKKALYQQLVHADLAPEVRGMIRGQIKMIESLPLMVEGLAKNQKKKEAEREAPLVVPEARGWRSLLPQIY